MKAKVGFLIPDFLRRKGESRRRSLEEKKCRSEKVWKCGSAKFKGELGCEIGNQSLQRRSRSTNEVDHGSRSTTGIYFTR